MNSYKYGDENIEIQERYLYCIKHKIEVYEELLYKRDCMACDRNSKHWPKHCSHLVKRIRQT